MLFSQGAEGRESVTLASPLALEAESVGSSRLGLLQPHGGSQEVKRHTVAKCPRSTQNHFASATLGNRCVLSQPRGTVAGKEQTAAGLALPNSGKSTEMETQAGWDHGGPVRNGLALSPGLPLRGYVNLDESLLLSGPRVLIRKSSPLFGGFKPHWQPCQTLG